MTSVSKGCTGSRAPGAPDARYLAPTADQRRSPTRSRAVPVDAPPGAPSEGQREPSLEVEIGGVEADRLQLLLERLQQRRRQRHHAARLVDAPLEHVLGEQEGPRIDHSISQYGVLGLWACARAGYEVPNSFWRASSA